MLFGLLQNPWFHNLEVLFSSFCFVWVPGFVMMGVGNRPGSAHKAHWFRGFLLPPPCRPSPPLIGMHLCPRSNGHRLSPRLFFSLLIPFFVPYVLYGLPPCPCATDPSVLSADVLLRSSFFLPVHFFAASNEFGLFFFLGSGRPLAVPPLSINDGQSLSWRSQSTVITSSFRSATKRLPISPVHVFIPFIPVNR